MKKILIACDIGNTNIDLGFFRTEHLIFRKKFPIKRVAALGAFLKGILAAKKINAASLEALVICSVVPRASRALSASLFKLVHVPIYILGESLFCPIKSLYRKPKQLGRDRLVNAYAGMVLYGTPVVVIDLGTAITFDVVSKNKEYLGGMILPGLEMSRSVLSERTALLPRVKLAKPKEFLGRDTKSSILSGLVYGFSGLTDNLIGKIKKKIGEDARVVATGGNARLIKKYSSAIDIVDDSLTLRGLELTYRKNNFR